VSTITPRSPSSSGEGLLMPVTNRYEAKYTIASSLVDEVAHFIRPYCSLDKYSELSENGFYTINSLYLDSPRFFFLRQRLSRAPTRFNMRIRTYGEEPLLPYFLEIKQKNGDVVRKYRAKIFTPDIYSVLNGCVESVGEDSQDTAQSDNLRRFSRLVHQYNAQPHVLVQYSRKAYVSDCDDYARVTFDRNLCTMQQNEPVPLPVAHKMIPCDVQTCFDPGASVILELKCYTTHVPLWMIDLVRTFQLRRRGFSKYTTCMLPLLDRYSGGSWSRRTSAIDRFSQTSFRQ
jgi:hypothetical protein